MIVGLKSRFLHYGRNDKDSYDRNDKDGYGRNDKWITKTPRDQNKLAARFTNGIVIRCMKGMAYPQGQCRKWA